jgi:hypothetical protein
MVPTSRFAYDWQTFAALQTSQKSDSPANSSQRISFGPLPSTIDCLAIDAPGIRYEDGIYGKEVLN